MSFDMPEADTSKSGSTPWFEEPDDPPDEEDYDEGVCR